MARHEEIIIHLSDDLTGEVGADVTTRTFGFNGTLEIDVNPENGKRLDAALEQLKELHAEMLRRSEEIMGEFVRAARKVGPPVLKAAKGGRKGKIAKRAKGSSDGIDMRALRARGVELGYGPHMPTRARPGAAMIMAIQAGTPYDQWEGRRADTPRASLIDEGAKRTGTPGAKAAAKKAAARKGGAA